MLEQVGYPSPMTEPAKESDERAARLSALMLHLRGHQFVADVVGGTHVRCYPPARPSAELHIRCALRPDDSGTLWYAAKDRWLSEATDVTGALIQVKRLTAGM